MSRAHPRHSSARTTTGAAAPLRLHIDRLVLDGLAPGTGGIDGMRAALEAEIGSLFSAGELHPALRAGGALPCLRIDADGLGEADSGEQLGRGIASALHRGMAR